VRKLAKGCLVPKEEKKRKRCTPPRLRKVNGHPKN
jgi:hypothetical protein